MPSYKKKAGQAHFLAESYGLSANAVLTTRIYHTSGANGNNCNFNITITPPGLACEAKS